MNIVLTGSLGHISQPLAAKLVANRHSVTVISSNANRQEEIEKLGAKPAIGSIEDPDFLIAAFANADAAYCMIPLNYGKNDQDAYFREVTYNYVQAIKQNDIRLSVFLTGWAVETESPGGISNLLNQLSDRTLIELRPGSFYTNFYNNIKMIKEHNALMAGYGGEDKMAFVSPKDIATSAYKEFTDPFPRKRIRYVTSEELTCNQAAKILGEAIDKPDLQWITLSEEQVLNGLIQAGLSKQLANSFAKMQTAIHSGKVFNNYAKHRPELGKTKLKEFAKEFAKVYHQR